MEIRTDRLGVLIDQLVDSKELSAGRLAGITAAEFLWEPVKGMWSVRPRDEAATPDAFGPGEWLLDHDRSVDPFAAAPLTTIAGRVGPLSAGFAGRWEWAFGEGSMEVKLPMDRTGSPVVAMEALWRWVDRLAKPLEALTVEQLDVPGFGAYPCG